MERPIVTLEPLNWDPNTQFERMFSVKDATTGSTFDMPESKLIYIMENDLATICNAHIVRPDKLYPNDAYIAVESCYDDNTKSYFQRVSQNAKLPSSTRNVTNMLTELGFTIRRDNYVRSISVVAELRVGNKADTVILVETGAKTSVSISNNTSEPDEILIRDLNTVGTTSESKHNIIYLHHVLNELVDEIIACPDTPNHALYDTLVHAYRAYGRSYQTTV